MVSDTLMYVYTLFRFPTFQYYTFPVSMQVCALVEVNVSVVCPQRMALLYGGLLTTCSACVVGCMFCHDVGAIC